MRLFNGVNVCVCPPRLAFLVAASRPSSATCPRCPRKRARHYSSLLFYPFCFNIPLCDVGKALGRNVDCIQLHPPYVFRKVVDIDAAIQENCGYVPDKYFLKLPVARAAVGGSDIGSRFDEEPISGPV